MSDLLAILHTPGSAKVTKNALINKLNNIIAQLNLGKAKIKVNPRLPINDYLAGKSKKSRTLIIGWGLQEKPFWETIIPEPKYFGRLRQLIAIDLFERKGLNGQVLERPVINAGKYWSRRTQQYRRNLFFEGHFLQASTPYGLKKVKVFGLEKNNPSSMPLFTFKPGKASEIEILRMIFDLFVNHSYNRQEICNLLNAQEISAPNNGKAWNPKTIKTILACPMYIGDNQYREFIKLDVFTPILDKSVFYEAQARLSKNNIVTENGTFR